MEAPDLHQPTGISHVSDAGIRTCMAILFVGILLLLEVYIVSNSARAKSLAKRSDLYQWKPSTMPLHKGHALFLYLETQSEFYLGLAAQAPEVILYRK